MLLMVFPSSSESWADCLGMVAQLTRKTPKAMSNNRWNVFIAEKV
jgi:hypothetical protein